MASDSKFYNVTQSTLAVLHDSLPKETFPLIYKFYFLQKLLKIAWDINISSYIWNDDDLVFYILFNIIEPNVVGRPLKG